MADRETMTRLKETLTDVRQSLSGLTVQPSDAVRNARMDQLPTELAQLTLADCRARGHKDG